MQEDSFWPQHVGLDMELAKDTAEKYTAKKKTKHKGQRVICSHQECSQALHTGLCSSMCCDTSAILLEARCSCTLLPGPQPHAKQTG